MRQTIFENEYFEFIRRTGVGANNTPWTALRVEAKGLAEKHVVEVRLNRRGFPQYSGTPLVEEYTGAEVSHGMRMMSDTLDETREYIEVLQQAVTFAEAVNNWLYRNDYHA